MAMHRAFDFREALTRLPDALRPELEQAVARHCAAGRVVEAVVDAVGPDTFTVTSERDGTSTWPFPWALPGLRRGRRCLLVLGGEEEVVGLGDAGGLEYVTLPLLVAVWVESTPSGRRG